MKKKFSKRFKKLLEISSDKNSSKIEDAISKVKKNCTTKKSETDFGELDLIITESTYGSANHKPRDEVEETFVNFARKVVERKGVLLVPAFAIGRSQEIACVLKKHNFPYPVAIDGMALRANDILVKHQNYLRDPKLFNKALNSANIVNDWGERRKVIDNPGVIIAPAGMLVGGTAAYYKKIITKNT